MSLVLMEASVAVTGIQTALEQLKSDAGTLIPVALGVSVVVFGAGWLWRKARGLVR